jgi:hypothetical protein
MLSTQALLRTMPRALLCFSFFVLCAGTVVLLLRFVEALM